MRPRDQKGKRLGAALIASAPWLLSTLALMLAGLAAWIRFEFGVVTFDQIVMNLPVVGDGDVSTRMLFAQASLMCVVLPILAVLVAAWLRQRLGSARPPGRGRWLGLALPALALAISLGVLLSVSGLPAYAAALFANRTMAGYYVPPVVTGGNPDHPKNLITIYLESVEETFRDEAVFGQNLLADLDSGTAGWANYDGLQQYPGGGWTMAGFISTQCGIPLKVHSLAIGRSANRLGEESKQYLPGATCLGDILAAHGYINAFVGGADPRFAGKGTYLRDHGYSIVKGLEDWRASGDEGRNFAAWGLSDARMLVHARDTLRSLRNSGSPFMLTLLTLDTHNPPGIFDTCGTDDVVREATALKCSMRAVAGFLADLNAQGYLEDTVVAVMTDHLKAMGETVDYRAALGGVPQRTLLLRVSSPDAVTFSRSGADQFSVLASSLELLGFHVPDGRAGLGVSFVSPHDLTGTPLALPADEYTQLIDAPSSVLYDQFWQGK